MTLATATLEDLRNLLNGMGEFFQRDSVPDMILSASRARMDTADEPELRQQVEELVGFLPAGVTLAEVAEVGA